MTKKISERLALGLLFALLILAVPALNSLRSSTITGRSNTNAAPPNVEAADFTPLGKYTGSVDLHSIYSGTHSNGTTSFQQIDLGDIGLALSLSRNGNQIEGYVLLDKTLVFPQAAEVPASSLVNYVGDEAAMVAVGPRVNGTFNGTEIRLVSDEFSVELIESGELVDGRELPAKVVRRQFTIDATADSPDALTLTGEYRETMWGYSPEPTTLVGDVTLTRPEFQPIDSTPVTPTATPSIAATATPHATPENRVYLPVVTGR